MVLHHTRRAVATLLGWAVALLLVGLEFAGAAVAHTGDSGVHHHDGWMGMDGWLGAGFGFLWMVVFLGIVVGFVYLLATRTGSETDKTDDALDALRRRYARGDIDEDEFETRRRKLETGRN